MRSIPARQRVSPALWVALPAVALIATGCTMTQPGTPNASPEGQIAAQLMAWPSLEDTQRQVQGAVDEIASAATRIVPGIRFADYHGESGLSCTGPYEGTEARGRYLPDRTGEGATISEAQWAEIVEATKAAAAKLDMTDVSVMKDGPADHDVWFTGPGGSSIKLAYRVNLVISGYTGCRLLEKDR